MILVNFKTYKEASGGGAVSLAKKIAGLSNDSIVACPQAVDLAKVSKILPRNTWVQHMDSVERGKSTGWFPAEAAKEHGASGVILNHSEHKLEKDEIGDTISICRQFGITVLVFAENLDEAKVVAAMEPDWVGYEPPELIASKETSVARARPEVIKSVVEAIPDVKVIVGAGVKSKEDVEISLKLGAKGVALSSAVVLSEDPGAVLKDLVEGFAK